MKRAAVAVGLLMAGLVVSPGLWSQDKDHAELAKAVAGAKVSLEQGLTASTHAGKGNAFSEVVVDHNTGKAAKTEAITSGEDLSAAKTQNEAMTKAKQSLHTTFAKVLKADPGFRAVSIFPALKDGHPVAEITLTKGDEWKTVSETLD